MTQSQESKLKRIYKEVLLIKLRLGKKFLRKVLYTRLVILGIGLIVLKTTIVAVIVKLYLLYERYNGEISKLINYIEVNRWIEIGNNRGEKEVKDELFF